MLQATLLDIGGQYTQKNRDGNHIQIRGEATNGEKPIMVEIRMNRAEARKVLHDIQAWLDPT